MCEEFVKILPMATPPSLEMESFSKVLARLSKDADETIQRAVKDAVVILSENGEPSTLTDFLC